MTTDRSQQGKNSAERGAIAERTFNDMLGWWLSDANAAPASQLIPDTQKVDVKVTIPSLWPEVENIETNWQIKATAERPRETEKNPLNEHCFRFQLSKSSLLGLREFCRSSQTLFLALAVQRDPRVRPGDLLQLPPFERFDWYAIDLKQYIESVDWDDPPSAIYIPVQNRLNLAIFSLLWGALWVQRFFRPLENPNVLHVPDLATHISQIFNRDAAAIRADEPRSWKFLTEELPKYSGELDDRIFRQVNFRLGLGGALEIIRSQLWEAAGRLDEVRNYCPEALYGTANLWLFSRVYRQFMETSALVGTAHPSFRGQRLLPLSSDLPANVPRILRCTLWHVVISYGLLNTDVRIVMRPEKGAGEDHSYYGGGIGYFPWISLTADQANWMVGTEKQGDIHEHIDFLDQQEQSVYLRLPKTFVAVAHILEIDQDQLRLPNQCPVMLFPPEDRFMRHPHDLFSPRRYGILFGAQPK